MWRGTKIILSILTPILLILSFAGLWICKFNQWDAFTFVTIVPFWMWAMPGILLSLVSAFFIRSRLSGIALAIWCLTTVFASAETWGLFRSAISNNEKRKKNIEGITLKLVSINCHNGNIKALHKAFAMTPDILLLQEIPDNWYIEELSWRLFGFEGNYIAGGSNAMIGKGEFLTFAEETTSPSIHARFKHSSGILLDLTNVELEQALPDDGFWTAAAREQTRLTRIKNRKSVRKIVDSYQPNVGQPIRIVAGDFATSPGDDIFRPMKKAGLSDAFHTSGRGTGNSYPEQFPVFRFDQVWISPEAQLLKTYTLPSEYSDHKILVCEFIVNPAS